MITTTMKNKFERLDCFVPANLAFELKKIGFDEECLLQHIDVYDDEHNFINFPYDENTDISIDLEDCTLKRNSDLEDDCLSIYKEFRKVVMLPTWEQAIEWFIGKGVIGNIVYLRESFFKKTFYNVEIKDREGYLVSMSNKITDIYEEAREELLKMMIEFLKNEMSRT